MIKLYKKEAEELYYAESWVEDCIATVHTGIVGTIGECSEEDCDNAKNYLKAFKAEYEARGYRAIPDSEMFWIKVKWEIAASEPDAAEEEIIAAVYDSLNEAFGWFGLGYADGFETEEENGKYFIGLYALSVDKELGIAAGNDTAARTLPDGAEYNVTAEKFN